MEIKIKVNGKAESIKDKTSVEDFLAAKKIRKETVVVELGGKIVEREKFPETVIKEGDNLEFVFYMGGGLEEKAPKPDFFVDLREELCPLNYVKTKLMLETMHPGETLEVLLAEGEAMRNVPKSVQQDGQEIVKIVKKDDEYYSLIIKKK